MKGWNSSAHFDMTVTRYLRANFSINTQSTHLIFEGRVRDHSRCHHANRMKRNNVEEDTFNPIQSSCNFVLTKHDGEAGKLTSIRMRNIQSKHTLEEI